MRFPLPHRWAWPAALALLALLCGAIYLSPHLFRMRLLAAEGRAYEPLSLRAYYDETNVTGPRAREILDGHWYVSEIDIVEHLGAPAYLPLAPPVLLAPLVLAFRDVSAAFIAGDFLFPALYFLIFVAIGTLLFRGHRGASAVFASLMALFPFLGLSLLPTNLNQVRALITNLAPFQWETARDRLSLAMMESSIPDFLVFGPCLYFLIRWYQENRRRDAVILGVLFGASFYTYFYHWAFVAGVIGLLLAFLLVRRDRLRIANLGIALGIGLLLGSGYFLLNAAVRQIPHSEEILARLWIEKGRHVRWSDWPHYLKVALLTAGLWGVARSRRSTPQDKATVPVLAALLLTGPLVLNAQLITGFNVQPSHWLPRTNVFAIDFAVAFLLFWLFRNLRPASAARRAVVAVAVIAVVFQFTGGLHSQYVQARVHAASMTLEPHDRAALTWIDRSLPTDAVVATPSLVTNALLPVHTPARIFVPRANNSFSSTEEMFNRLAILYRFYDIPEGHLWAILDREVNAQTWTAGRDGSYDALEQRGLNFFFNGAALPSEVDGYKRNAVFDVPAEVREHAVAQYRAAGEFLPAMLTRYRMDYVYVGPRERALARRDMSAYPFLEPVYDAHDVTIYRVKKELLPPL